VLKDCEATPSHVKWLKHDIESSFIRKMARSSRRAFRNREAKAATNLRRQPAARVRGVVIIVTAAARPRHS